MWGKLIGSFLGFALGGPLGLIVGFIIGHLRDSRPRAPAYNPYDPYSVPSRPSLWSLLFRPRFKTQDSWEHAQPETAQQKAFTSAVVVLCAKMAKADGRVTQDEIRAFKRAFNIQPHQEKEIGRIFDEARRTSDDYEPHAFQVAHQFRVYPGMLEEIMSGLFIIAAADSSTLSSVELRYLSRVATIFGFDTDDMMRIAARVGVRYSSGAGHDRRAHHSAASQEERDAYTVLGLAPTATNDVIKSAYRALIREHHPDRLVAQGMAPAFIASATEKMKRINAAYDTLCRLKGIK